MEIINQVKQEIKRIDPEAGVILFGSRARGDYREDSDGDFLILLERPLVKEDYKSKGFASSEEKAYVEKAGMDAVFAVEKELNNAAKDRSKKSYA